MGNLNENLGNRLKIQRRAFLIIDWGWSFFGRPTLCAQGGSRTAFTNSALSSRKKAQQNQYFFNTRG